MEFGDSPASKTGENANKDAPERTPPLTIGSVGTPPPPPLDKAADTVCDADSEASAGYEMLKNIIRMIALNLFFMVDTKIKYKTIRFFLP